MEEWLLKSELEDQEQVEKFAEKEIMEKASKQMCAEIHETYYMGNISSSRSKEQMESLFINKKTQKEAYLSWWKNKSKETCILRIFILSIRHYWREKSHNSAYPAAIPEIKVQREKSYKLQDKKKKIQRKMNQTVICTVFWNTAH